jgi:hypothetical protein
MAPRVASLAGEQVAAINVFLDPALPARFGLPARLPG